jgi:hypothetical protein
MTDHHSRKRKSLASPGATSQPADEFSAGSRRTLADNELLKRTDLSFKSRSLELEHALIGSGAERGRTGPVVEAFAGVTLNVPILNRHFRIETT